MRGLLQMAWINVLNYTHSGTKLLNSYTIRFEGEFSNHLLECTIITNIPIISFFNACKQQFCFQNVPIILIYWGSKPVQAVCMGESGALNWAFREVIWELILAKSLLWPQIANTLAVLWHKMQKDYEWNVIRKMPKHHI